MKSSPPTAQPEALPGAAASAPEAGLQHGIHDNLEQFLQLLLQVFLVGCAIGMMRTVVPALAESEFGVPRGSFVLLTTFVVAFGFVKGAVNFFGGELSERVGRKRVLLWGWLCALPIPAMVLWGPTWSWIVAATVLLGINQGLAWSMTVTAMLDVTRPDERGLTVGLNEFAGYVGMALAGIATGYLAVGLGPRVGLALFGVLVLLPALALAAGSVRDTRPWALAEARRDGAAGGRSAARAIKAAAGSPNAWEVFRLVSWRDRRFFALSQAGMAEKFVDALVWVFYPVYFHRHGVSLAHIGWIVGCYGFVWAGAQLLTGRLSDHIGRHALNVGGMWLSGLGVALMPAVHQVWWWSLCAALSGLGMAMLYPNLIAAVADIAHPTWRGSALGVYRFWRDAGYGFGALGMGFAAVATGALESGFWFVACGMFVSGFVLWRWGEETHPRINPV
ncbi:MAG TPA: MFS transporter [Burkholderiales bacterium]|nr:MFS transporter [Burkholderiales bacterium]